MTAADKLVDVMKELISQDLKETDQVVLCRVAAVHDDGVHYDVAVGYDEKNLLHNVVNMTKFDLEVGDSCYVFKVQNGFTNSFICYKVTGDFTDPITAAAVAAAKKFQEKLISGINIKTINNESLLGQGNIEIEGGGGGGGGVTSITAGGGLTGGTITTEGTIAVDTSVIQPKLTPGNNIAIENNIISADVSIGYEEVTSE